MNVCMYACVYVCMRVSVCVCTWAHTNISTLFTLHLYYINSKQPIQYDLSVKHVAACTSSDTGTLFGFFGQWEVGVRIWDVGEGAVLGVGRL